MSTLLADAGRMPDPEPIDTIERFVAPPGLQSVVGPGFGVHLTLDGYGGSAQLLADGDHVLACLSELPERLGMHKLADPFLMELGHQGPKDPGGVTGFVIIAESHISIHTFPLRGFVSADVYTCQSSLDTQRICAYFTEAFGLQDLEVNFVRRGTRYPQHNIYGAAQQSA
jgi:S-adenosylmethionine decarboxylase